MIKKSIKLNCDAYVCVCVFVCGMMYGITWCVNISYVN